MKNKKKVILPLPYRILRWTFPKIEKISPWLANKWALRLFFHPIRYPFPEREKPMLNQLKQDTIMLNGNKVVTYSLGEGIPVLLVHGWSGRATQFWRFMEEFTKAGFKVVSFDAPGHGKSTGKRTSIMEYSEIIEQLVKKHQIKTIIGHSFGGVSGLLASINGATHTQLMMIGSPSIESDLLGEFLNKINGKKQSLQAIHNHVKTLTGKPFEAFMSSSLITQVKNLKILVLHDENDKEVGLAHAINLKKIHPQLNLIRTKGYGHNRILIAEEAIQHAMQFAKEPTAKLELQQA